MRSVFLVSILSILLLSVNAPCEEGDISLPTIKIYGERKLEEVMFGEKKELSRALSFQADRPFGEREIIDLEGISGIPEKKPLMEISPGNPKGIFSIGVRYGKFDSSELMMEIGGEKDVGGFFFGAKHMSSEGHVEGSKSSLGGAETAIMFRMSDRLTGYLGAKGFGGQEGLWRFSEVRDTESWEGLLRLNFAFDKLMDANLNFGFNSLRLSDRGSSNWANENRSSIEMNGSFTSEKLSLRGRIGYDADFLRRCNVGKEKQFLFRSSGLCRFPLREDFVAGFGMSLYHLGGDKTKAVSYFFGSGEVLFVRSRIRYLIRFKPGLSMGSLSDAYSENHFLDLRPSFPYRKRPFDLTNEFWFEVWDNLEAGIKAGYTIERNFPVWVESDSSTWTYGPGELVGKSGLELAMRGKMWERFSVYTSFNLVDSKFRSGDRDRKVPYVPGRVGKLDLGLKVFRRLFLYGKIEVLGRRYVAPVPNSDTLDPYFLASFEISQYIGSGFRLYVYGDNIFGEKYEVWKGYTMPGTAWYVGIENLWL